MSKVIDNNIKYQQSENIIKLTKVFRLKAVGDALNELIKKNQEYPYIVFDFRDCGNLYAASSLVDGVIIRVDSNVVVVYNKVMKVMRPVNTQYNLFVIDQRLGENGSTYLTRDFAVDITVEAINVKKTGYYEDVLRHLEDIVGYLKCPDGTFVPCWRSASISETAPVRLPSEPALDISRKAMAEFVTFKSRRPFSGLAANKAPSAKVDIAPPNKSYPAPEELPPIIEPTSVIEPIIEAAPEPEPIIEAAPVIEPIVPKPEPIKEPEPAPAPAPIVPKPEPAPAPAPIVPKPEPIKEPEPAPAPIPAPMPSLVTSFAPIAQRNVMPFAIITWGGIRMVRFNVNVTVADLAKNIGADILYFKPGTDSNLYGSLVMGGQYMLTTGTESTGFPGVVLFKKEVVERRESGNFVIKVRTGDSSPCNIPTSFVGATLIK